MTEQLDMFAAETRKQDGMRRAWDHASPDWKERALAGLLHVAATTTADVQICELRRLPGIGHPIKHQAWGSLSKIGAALGWLTPAEFQRSKLVTTHGSMLRAWYGTETARRQHDPADCLWCRLSGAA